MSNKKNLLLLILLVINFISFSQEKKEEEKKFSFSGSVDAYYRANINAPNSPTISNGETIVSPNTSFANLPGFALGMVNLIAKYEGKKVGFVADLVFGPRGEDAIFLSGTLRPDGTSNIVNQLYMYWNVNDKIKLTLGNFNTFLGYEVISPTGNFHYSTSYLFSNGPFSHTGLKADFALDNDVSLMLAIMNPTDATEFDPTGKYSFGAQLGYANQYLNFVTDDGAFEIDYTGGFDVSGQFYLGLNAAYYDGKDNNPGYYGVALYPEYIISQTWEVGLRLEYFGEHGGNFGAIGTTENNSNVFATVLSANYKVGDLTIIPELRIDAASDSFFYNSNDVAKKNLSSFVLAAVYKF